MTGDAGTAAALRPLWTLTLAAAAAATAAWWVPDPGPPWLRVALGSVGAGCLGWALWWGRRAATVLWLVAGVALVGSHGLQARADRLEVAGLIDGEGPAAVRARVAVADGWVQGRWGWRAGVRVLSATRSGASVPLPGRSRLEIRGPVDALALPPPGTVVDVLAGVRGEPATPLLVASSPRLVEPAPGAAPALLAEWRDRLARGLLEAAGHDVGRIRAAELAAALALGRRDLIPAERREGWRRSGLAHVLAVSGLHVGLVAGAAWLALAAFGASPTATRLVLLILLPTYALLAGAAPSAVRAALMGVVYLGARLLGRALVPMAAVLLTAFALLLADPGLVGDVSFQLTVLLTAALVRWAPPLASFLPGPRWLAAALAVPVVAQLAAAPLVAVHFSSTVPGAALANIAVPWLLTPVVLAAVAATATAPLAPALAGGLLTLVGLGERGLWLLGTPGRAGELVPPDVPPALLVAVAVAGIAALLPGRPARAAVAAYLLILAASAVWWRLAPPAGGTVVELLPVPDGLSVRIGHGATQLLMDGGARRRDAASSLAAARVRDLDAVLASHGDSDHVEGLGLVLATVDTDRLVLPAWLVASPEAVPLLRVARRRGITVSPVVRGSRLTVGDTVLEVLWPPAAAAPADDNERSLVVRVGLGPDAVLLTGDIGRATEARLAGSTNLAASVLIVPHHGSRLSASPPLLDAAASEVALIPAGPDNLHNHPHPSVLARLDERGIPYRMPVRDGRCGARLQHGRWLPFPELPPAP
ncbi:MAG TPA: DNA internalization-related competence protein ComEC/Rec2 [Methylomirabilota bacterium]|nr:DNA internalization-related competence protein ComEC/Rec2 [Methylomirabilota bacterium]